MTSQKLLKAAISYRYFVSYLYEIKNGMGYGMTELTMKFPFKGMDDVRIAIQEIKRNGKINGSVVIINWILL